MKIISIITVCCWWLLVLVQICRGINDMILSDVQIEHNDDTLVEENLSGDTEPFIPTKEWQVVKENQAVPAGLHIRMNFQTGIKEAKFLDDDRTSSPQSKASKGPKVILSEENKNINEFPHDKDKIYFTKSHLKEALNDFRDKVGTKDVDEITWSSDAKSAVEEQIAQEARVKKNFRTIEEIKAELEDTMNMKIKSDVEIMKENLFFVLAKNSTVEDVGVGLDNLEYYVHQIDNGIDLNTIGGLEPIVYLLNSTNEHIQEKAANVIGAATQNNNKVQNAVLDYGGLRLLLQMMNEEKNALTKKKALYALSALIRGNSKAQNELVKLNGIENIMKLIKDKHLLTSLHIKAIDLLFDLIEEQKRPNESSEIDVHEKSDLLSLLVESGICNMLIPMLKTEDFYTKEKVMNAIRVSVDVCKDTFKQVDHLDILEHEVSQLYLNIKEEEDKDFKVYLETLKNQLEKNVLEKLRT